MKKLKWMFLFLLLLLIILFIMFSSRIGRIRDLESVTEVFSILSEERQWGEVTKLNIFNNARVKEKTKERIIHPGSHGIYKFVVQNDKSTDVDYQIIFSDEYNIPIQMKYKFMTEKDYISNKKSDWLTIEQLQRKSTVSAKSKDSYVLEWFWEEGNQDTDAGFDGGYYTLNLEVTGESL